MGYDTFFFFLPVFTAFFFFLSRAFFFLRSKKFPCKIITLHYYIITLLHYYIITLFFCEFFFYQGLTVGGGRGVRVFNNLFFLHIININIIYVIKWYKIRLFEKK